MRKINLDCPGLLAPLDNRLLRYVFQLHDQGMVVTTQIVSIRASDLCQIFHANLDGAKSLIVHSWLKAQGLSYQMGTNESQHSPAKAASDVLDFMQEIRKKVSEKNHEKNVINMDQTQKIQKIWIKPQRSKRFDLWYHWSARLPTWVIKLSWYLALICLDLHWDIPTCHNAQDRILNVSTWPKAICGA